MRVFAYCTLPAHTAVSRATGVEPYTSPPLEVGADGSENEFRVANLSGYDLLYFRLHAFTPWVRDMWFGECANGTLIPALTLECLGEAKLDGAVAVVANCYGADDPMAQELYRRGASTVIAGYGPNYAAATHVVGADLLVKLIIAGMRLGLDVRWALAVAKARLVLSSWRASDRDALQFQIIKKESVS